MFMMRWLIDGRHTGKFVCHAEDLGRGACDLQLRLHGRGFKSKRFHDLETTSKTTGFQSVYMEPIQPLNPTVYVKAISFSGL